MPRGLPRFVMRRAALAVLLVLLASSTALLLVHLAPGDHLAGFDSNPAVVAAERHRLGLDKPIAVQYIAWLGRALRLDLGISLKYGRPVSQLIAERAPNTLLLGLAALVLATAIGLPLGVFTGSRPTGLLSSVARSAAIVLLSLPPLVTSFALLLLAARTGWFPVGGFGASRAATLGDTLARARYLVLPALALGLPLAAWLERVQSRAIADALADPCMLAAMARGLPRRRVVWRHGLRLSLKPVLAIYGVLIGTILSGSFIVEIVMSWPGLGALMYEGLVARDLYLVAGCAAVGSLFLAAGVLASDVALAAADPALEIA